MPAAKLVYLLNVKVDGAALSDEQTSHIRWLSIDSSLHIPDMFIIHFEEIEDTFLDSGPFGVGKSIELGLSDAQDNVTTIFKGEITALEPIFDNNRIALDIRGYDKAHRLHRGKKSKVFKNVTDSDIVTQVAQAAGLTVDAESTSFVHEHVFQDAMTDFQFLEQRADRIGYILYSENGTLKFKKQTAPSSGELTLTLNENLMSFRPRLTLAEQVDTVTVKGWDPKQKAVVVGTASSSSVNSETGFSGSGGSIAQSAVGSATRLEVRRPTTNQSEATTIAQGILDSVNADFIEADGKADGAPGLHAGMVIEVKGAGQKFSGKYRLTTVHHEYTAGDYETSFSVEGIRPDLLSDILESPSNNYAHRWPSVVTALVTNNNDPEDWGRVKLKFPWLDADSESTWARVIVPGGGAERGIYFMPEINDEVIVAFEQGDFNIPYVIGGLYNGTDKPALPIGDAVVSGKVAKRVIKTRVGHKITFVDDNAGDDYIEIIDDKGNTSIKFDAQNKKVTIMSQGEVEINATGNLTLNSQQDISITTQSGNVKIQGMTFSAKGQSSVEMKADSGTATVQGLSLSVKGTADGTVDGGAMLTVKGGVVMIN